MSKLINAAWERTVTAIMGVWVLFTPYTEYQRGVFPLRYAMWWGFLGTAAVVSIALGRYQKNKWGSYALQWSPLLQFFITMAMFTITLWVAWQSATIGKSIEVLLLGGVLLALFYSEGVAWGCQQLTHRLK